MKVRICVRLPKSPIVLNSIPLNIAIAVSTTIAIKGAGITLIKRSNMHKQLLM